MQDIDSTCRENQYGRERQICTQLDIVVYEEVVC